MSNEEKRIIQSIKEDYSDKPVSKLDELKKLDSKVYCPAKIFAYTFGTIGSLVLGTGMCFAMKTIGATLSFAMPLGIAVGLVGIIMVTVNWFAYKKILYKRKKKYADEVLALTEELLNK